MQKAQGWAHRVLSRRYPVEYRDLYLKYKEEDDNQSSNSIYQSRAKVALGHLYKSQYLELYDEAVKLGYVRAYPSKRKKVDNAVSTNSSA
jgi:hypothetical protein